jgi:hypothetical protein
MDLKKDREKKYRRNGTQGYHSSHSFLTELLVCNKITTMQVLPTKKN